MRVRNPKAIGELENEGERSMFGALRANVRADDECKELLARRTGWRQGQNSTYSGTDSIDTLLA